LSSLCTIMGRLRGRRWLRRSAYSCRSNIAITLWILMLSWSSRFAPMKDRLSASRSFSASPGNHQRFVIFFVSPGSNVHTHLRGLWAEGVLPLVTFIFRQLSLQPDGDVPLRLQALFFSSPWGERLRMFKGLRGSRVKGCLLLVRHWRPCPCQRAGWWRTT
jgi:hypothetical protein